MGISFDGKAGVNNAITDVPGVEVGYKTLIEGSGKLVTGKGPVRTGVTVILPKGKTSGPLDGGQRHQERELEGQHALRVDIGDEGRVEGAAQGREEGRDGGGRHLGLEDHDAEALGRVRVVLHGAPPIAPARVLDRERDEPGDDAEGEGHVDVGQLRGRGELQGEPVVRPGDRPVDAGRGARPVPVVGEQEPGLGDHDGRDREVVSGEPEQLVAEGEREHRRDHAADQHAEDRQDVEPREEERRRVGADAEIERVAERDLAAIAAEDVPALRQGRVEERQDDDVLRVDVRDDERQAGDEDGEARGRDQLAPPPGREGPRLGLGGVRDGVGRG